MYLLILFRIALHYPLSSEGGDPRLRLRVRSALSRKSRKIFGVTFGNRFRGVFRLPDAAKP